MFGPFLALIVPAGVTQVTFGASSWLVVITVASVSMMYRMVMCRVTDATGGSGLSEEEFGLWAARLNASIRFIEYTLTILVRIPALVTFLADRISVLRGGVGGLEARLAAAVAFALSTGGIVNAGPRVSARIFGPATAGVLALPCLLMGSAVWHRASPRCSCRRSPT